MDCVHVMLCILIKLNCFISTHSFWLRKDYWHYRTTLRYKRVKEIKLNICKLLLTELKNIKNGDATMEKIKDETE